MALGLKEKMEWKYNKCVTFQDKHKNKEKDQLLQLLEEIQAKLKTLIRASIFFKKAIGHKLTIK